MMRTCMDYHWETSYDRRRMGGHFMDWANQPRVFKTYKGIEPVKLSRDLELSGRKVSSLLLDTTLQKPAAAVDRNALSRLLLLTCTLTARSRSQEGDFYFRSAASAGALYPTEVYTATQGVSGLQDGLYHYAIHEHGLVPLRNGSFGDFSLEAAGAAGRRTLPVVTFFLTAIFFRSAWKYRARAYRYHLMDTGHVEENLALALKALGLSYAVSYDFSDDLVNPFLGLDEAKEVALALVFVFGRDPAKEIRDEKMEPLPEPVLKASAVSEREVDYPAIREMHEAGKKIRPGQGLGGRMLDALGVSPKEWRETKPALSWKEMVDYPDCVFVRRSRRNFVKQPVSKENMAGLLYFMYASERDTYEESPAVGFLCGRVEGMEPGFYLLDRQRKAAGMVSQGAYLEPMARICLEQAWLVNAGIHFLFLADLELVEGSWGPRGYRYAMLRAGRLGQRLYVGATAMGLGCCGIGAFYDQEARDLLGLNESSRLLYLVAVGVVKRR